MAAVSSQALKLRVIVEADSIRKITLDTRPESVDDLKIILKDKLKLDADFSLQYEDPDFDGELISLVDIDELPQKATLNLFMAEVYAEFQRITNQNLPNIFYEELDRHTLHLMTLYRQMASKTGKTSDALADILRIHDLQRTIGGNAIPQTTQYNSQAGRQAPGHHRSRWCAVVMGQGLPCRLKPTPPGQHSANCVVAPGNPLGTPGHGRQSLDWNQHRCPAYRTIAPCT
ncbi:UNVERIFIED_CONTAM: hypothetical protein FKN15_006047 [Acipenser sinensis]